MTDSIPPTPAARIERAKRRLAEAVAELITAQLELGTAANEWVDQRTSPLGRRRHLEHAKSGTIPATRDGRRVLMRRADIDAYLDQRRIVRVDEKADRDREIDRVLEEMRRAGGIR